MSSDQPLPQSSPVASVAGAPGARGSSWSTHRGVFVVVVVVASSRRTRSRARNRSHVERGAVPIKRAILGKMLTKFEVRRG